MKKILLLALSAALLLSLCVFPASAAPGEEITETWDDYDNEHIKFYDFTDTEHSCELCGTGDDVQDNTGTYTWFQGGHLIESSGHFAHVGSYAIVKVENCSHIKWITQYRGPAADGYSTQATVYVDGEEVAVIGTETLNAMNDTARFTIWETDLDQSVPHEIKILNSMPMPEDFEGSEEDWMGIGKRLPIDGFEVTYISYETDPPLETYIEETEEPETTEAPATTAPAGTEGEGSGTTEAPEEGGCGGVIGTAAIVFAAVLAAPVAIARKRK